MNLHEHTHTHTHHNDAADAAAGCMIRSVKGF